MSVRNGYLAFHREGLAASLWATPNQPSDFDIFNFDAQVVTIVNHAMTAAWTANDPDINLFDDGDAQAAIVNMHWTPSSSIYRGLMSEEEYGSTPDDLGPGWYRRAPWYSNDVPESADALGFIMRTASGSDGGHYGRDAVQLQRGGARFTTPFAGSRVYAIQLAAVGRTTRGVEYLVRWLEARLKELDTLTPGIWSLVMRTWVPAAADVGDYASTEEWARDGVVIAGPATLLSGPSVEEAADPNIRIVTFTVGVGDPALVSFAKEPSATVKIRPHTTAPSTGTTLAACSDFSTARAVFQFPVDGTIGTYNFGGVLEHDIAPIINIGSIPVAHSSAGRMVLPDLQVRIMIQSGASVNPCVDSLVSAMRIRNLPSGAVLRLDYARRTAVAVDMFASASKADWIASFGGPAVHRDRREVRLRPGAAWVEESGTVFSYDSGYAVMETEDLSVVGGWNLNPLADGFYGKPSYVLVMPYYAPGQAGPNAPAVFYNQDIWIKTAFVEVRGNW